MAGGTRDAANNTKFLWWLVRVLKNEDGDLYPPGHAGAPKEKCACLACDKKLAAQTQRIASHYAQKRGYGVEICVGATSQRLDESETDFQERKRQFIAAKERCAEFLKEQERLKEKKREAERDRVHSEVTRYRGPVERFGSTVVSDGATDQGKRPVNNIIDVSPECVEFILAKDCTGHTKDKQFIADQVTEYIRSRPDPFKIVQVLMDNATRGSWPIIKAACPWVVVGPCEPHVGSLEVGDVCKLPFFKSVVRKVHVVRKFILYHQKTFAEFKKYYKFEVHEQLKAVTYNEDNPPWESSEADAPTLDDLKQEIISIHRYRWDYGYTILQGTRYLLDPEYVDMDQHEDEETMESFRKFVEKTYLCQEARRTC
ncbi:hypothetical protein CYMTET_53929 [Cymbomonas tetramitiformis]|uniref:DUF659 domain-containing protein n=1 Tax=Cymbomonas tetramitiformis TaxID=36881 RepID=A0AAE0EP88_9CHLO|nr:hypothetical protein CYMTET_53929 [Cymbomonas tetramitiformis]